MYLLRFYKDKKLTREIPYKTERGLKFHGRVMYEQNEKHQFGEKLWVKMPDGELVCAHDVLGKGSQISLF